MLAMVTDMNAKQWPLPEGICWIRILREEKKEADDHDLSNATGFALSFWPRRDCAATRSVRTRPGCSVCAISSHMSVSIAVTPPCLTAPHCLTVLSTDDASFMRCRAVAGAFLVWFAIAFSALDEVMLVKQSMPSAVAIAINLGRCTLTMACQFRERVFSRSAENRPWALTLRAVAEPNLSRLCDALKSNPLQESLTLPRSLTESFLAIPAPSSLFFVEGVDVLEVLDEACALCAARCA